METTIEVIEQSQVSQVRRLVVEIARSQAMSEEDIGRAALVATEISTNLVKYGQKGAVTICPYVDEGSVGVQMIAMDHGPGFPDFHASTRDGYSTGGSMGIGLGVVMRGSDVFDTYTPPGQGSALLARVARQRVAPGPTKARLAIGSRRAPKRGEVECGDAWAHTASGRWDRLCLVDGLGHGPLAAVASAAAITAFLEAGENATPQDVIQSCHAAMNTTRGAVMAVVAIDQQAGRFLFAGVGNITGMVHSAQGVNHLLSTEGIVGYQMRTVRVVERTWSAGDSVVMSSDGLTTRWSLARYPGLLQRHAALIAAVLFRDHGADTDDATVVVAKDLR
jgi:anti-sigma regulatory factor (Ser/Thr protein kinase)